MDEIQETEGVWGNKVTPSNGNCTMNENPKN